MIKPCALVAAIDLNHDGKEEVARRLIEAAVVSGCTAVKFQRRSAADAEWLPSRSGRKFPGVEKGDPDARETPDLSPESFKRIRDYARGKIEFIGAPLDPPSVEFLDRLDVDGFKIDPPHTLNLPLLERIALRNRKGRILVSLSFCTDEDIRMALDLLRGGDLVLVHEISLRPAPTEASQLGHLTQLRKYDLPIGYSDRGDAFFSAVAARTLGATVLEKGLTLCRELPGADHASGLEPDQMLQFVKGIRTLEASLSCDGPRRLSPHELDRYDETGIGLAAKRDIRAGETITEEMIAVKTPPVGLTPRFLKEIVGKKVLYDIQRDDPITFGLIDL